MSGHPRYTRAEMAAVWSDATRFQKMLDVEIAAAHAMAAEGLIPQSAADDIADKARVSIKRINEIEKETHHETIAFLTAVSEEIGESARFLHYGMTSSDVLDTAFSLQLRDAADIIIQDIEMLIASLKQRMIEHRATPCIGRSHGIHAEPMTFGLKIAAHYQAFKRHLNRLKQARKEISVCMVSGAVGTFSILPPTIEAEVAKKLGLTVEPVSTQIIPRDRHAAFFSVLAGVASSVENLVTEIRHLQRSEVAEVAEYFDQGQKGSSAMPHKRNPILSENLTGLARVVRSTLIPALENVTLWHERDMSHSSVERFIAPESTVTLDFALARLTKIIDGLIVYPERMQENIDRLGGLVYSQSVLLALTEKNVSRSEAYQLVQRNAKIIWEQGGAFLSALLADEDVMQYFDESELKKMFDQRNLLRHTDIIIERVLNDGSIDGSVA